MAFKNDHDGDATSVYLGDEAGSPEAVMAGHQGFGLVAVSVGLVQECGLRVVRRPEPGFSYHAVLVGPKTNAIARRLARAADWIIHVGDIH